MKGKPFVKLKSHVVVVPTWNCDDSSLRVVLRVGSKLDNPFSEQGSSWKFVWTDFARYADRAIKLV